MPKSHPAASLIWKHAN